MKKIGLSLFLFLMTLTSVTFADSQKNFDYDFQQDRMLLADDGIYMISSFENNDGICAYSYNGIRLWESSFHAKIVSWRIAGNCIFIFSKHRAGYKTYLTCIDRYTGKLVWERP